MKVLIDLSLIAAMMAMSYFADGWWALLALLPFVLLLVRYSPAHEQNNKSVTFSVPTGNYRYYVTTQADHTLSVETKFPVQFEGAWAHFSDEVTEFGVLVRKDSFYMPQRVQLRDDDVEPALRSVE